MKSFVRCPKCDRRLMVATDREGGKMHCPRCGTPFVLGSRTDAGSGGPSEFLAFELFDQTAVMDEIEVVEVDAQVTAAPPAAVRRATPKPVLPVLPVVPLAPVVKPVEATPVVPVVGRAAPAAEPGQRRAQRTRGGYTDAEYAAGEYDDLVFEEGKYVYHPVDAGKWKMVYWGITLVLLAILVYVCGGILLFFGLAFMAAGGAKDEGGLILLAVGFGLLAASDILRLVGYGLCIGVPPETMARGWTIMALGMSIFSAIPAGFAVALQSIISDPFIVRGVGGFALIMGMSSWASFLMFMERVCDVFSERGIADSVNAVIKLGATWTACIIVGLIAQSIILARDPTGQLLSGADPSVLVLAVCAGAFQAFTGILGSVVFVKYIFALLNVRAMIDWS